jgi:hypothetical protein
MTINEVIEELKRLDPTGNLPLVSVGWYGEALPITSINKVKTYTEKSTGNFGEYKRMEFEAIEISVPDKGEEPD